MSGNIPGGNFPGGNSLVGSFPGTRENQWKQIMF